MNEIRIYFEGDKALRPGFHAFFSSVRRLAQTKRCGFQLIATGARYRQDYAAAKKSHPDAWNVLLRDSEGPLTEDTDEPSVFWMVEIMESWFYADKEAIARFYGDEGFNRNALAANERIEKIPKKDVLEGLKSATRNTKKGPYHKTAHGPRLLAAIDPRKVSHAAPNCHRLFKALEERLNEYANS